MFRPNGPRAPRIHKGFAYLAAPYSEGDASEERKGIRYWQITATAARLSEKNIRVFSPITHGGPLERCGLERDHNWWLALDLEFLKLASAVYVLELPGWDKSIGVAKEIGFAKGCGIGVFHIMPDYDDIVARVGKLAGCEVNLDDR